MFRHPVDVLCAQNKRSSRATRGECRIRIFDNLQVCIYFGTLCKINIFVLNVKSRLWYIYRPGLLLCQREESRPLEAFGRALSAWLDIWSWWSISTSDVARVMVEHAVKNHLDKAQHSLRILEHSEIVQMAKNL